MGTMYTKVDLQFAQYAHGVCFLQSYSIACYYHCIHVIAISRLYTCDKGGEYSHHPPPPMKRTISVCVQYTVGELHTILQFKGVHFRQTVI